MCPICERATTQVYCPTDGVPTIDPDLMVECAAPVRPGDVLMGRYRLDRHLGSGAMGTVYLATQLSMNRQVAVKILPQDLNQHRERVRRFFLEALAVSRLNHPNIVLAQEFGIDDRTRAPFIAMEYIDGISLRDVTDAEGPIPVARALALLTQLARALTEAHHRGIVHRDLKPDNILVSTLSDGRELLKVLDFGVAKMVSESDADRPAMTGHGKVVGTPEFMSPEQARGEAIDGRSDLYAMGCILFTLIMGDPPYTHPDTLSVFIDHCNAPIPELPTRDVEGRPIPEALRDLYLRLMAKSPEGRPAGAREVAHALQDVLAALDSSTGGASRPAGGLPDDPQEQPTFVAPFRARLDRRVSRLRWAAGAALSVAAGVVALLLATSQRPAPVPPPPTVLAAAPAPATMPTAPLEAAERIAADRARAAAAEATPEPPPEPVEPARIRVVSDPTAARVEAGGRLIGLTPIEIERPEQALILTLKAPGFTDAAVRIGEDAPEQVAVSLSAEPRPKVRRRRRGRPKAAPEPRAESPGAERSKIPIW